METLGKHRGKGQQKVTVEHVHFTGRPGRMHEGKATGAPKGNQNA